MRDLDQKFAATCGVAQYEDLIDDLHVDIPVADGDVVKAGEMEFVAINFPGHTKCSVGFYLASEKLLIACETLGVYDGEKTIMPSYLVGVGMALESIAKAKALDVEYILAPHFGILNAEQSAFYFGNMEKSARETAEELIAILKNGSKGGIANTVSKNAVKNFISSKSEVVCCKTCFLLELCYINADSV